MSTDLTEDDQDEGDSKGQKKKFDDFLLAEYNTIAQAHFNTTTTIATFFRNYLLIVGLPIPILGFVLTQIAKENSAITIPKDITYIIPTVGWAIGVLGLCLMIYVVNLRLDALLYARTVNGLRMQFFNDSRLSYEEELRMRTLPRVPIQPRYIEYHYFFWVVAVFAILNSMYPLVGHVWHHHSSTETDTVAWWVFRLGIPVFFVTHFIWYNRLAHYRETSYLKKQIIGVDIDGVLNKHADRFCKLLWDFFGNSVWASQISSIPVHECPDITVTKQEADAIFNNPLYWNYLAAADEAAAVLHELRNAFGYKVFIFTYRPWPQPRKFPANDSDRYYRLWDLQYQWSGSFAGILLELFKWAFYSWRQFWLGLRQPWHFFWAELKGAAAMRAITKLWLKVNNFPYDRLVIERGDVYSTDPTVHHRNRFAISASHEIRIFVEDDPDKAKKLAKLCDIVFLIAQPYNRQASDLPKNVVRVENWNAILKYVRREL